MSKTLNLRVYHGDVLIDEQSLSQDVVKIGRLRSSHLHLEDDSVAHMHAVIESHGGEIGVIDLGSPAGTVLNGERVHRNALLDSGDTLEFGPFRVEVEIVDAQPSPPPPPSEPGPDIPKLLRRLAALHNIAVDQAETPEGKNASRMMASLMESHALDVSAEDLESFEIRCDNDHDWERDLAQLISRSTQTQLDIIDGKLRFRGLRIAVEEAVEHYEAHRKACRRLVAFTAVGYMIGTFGAETFAAHVRESQELSTTIREAQEAEDDDVFARKVSDAENNLIVVAGRIGEGKPVTFWKKLKARMSPATG